MNDFTVEPVTEYDVEPVKGVGEELPVEPKKFKERVMEAMEAQNKHMEEFAKTPHGKILNMLGIAMQALPAARMPKFEMPASSSSAASTEVTGNAGFRTATIPNKAYQSANDPLPLQGYDKAEAVQQARGVIRAIEGGRGQPEPMQMQQQKGVEGADFPKGYYDKVPTERRLSPNGISHPGFRWEIVDRQTGKVVGGPNTNRVRTNRSVDRMDNKYGGYRYNARSVKAETLTEEETAFLKEHGLE